MDWMVLNLDIRMRRMDPKSGLIWNYSVYLVGLIWLSTSSFFVPTWICISQHARLRA